MYVTLGFKSVTPLKRLFSELKQGIADRSDQFNGTVVTSGIIAHLERPAVAARSLHQNAVIMDGHNRGHHQPPERALVLMVIVGTPLFTYIT